MHDINQFVENYSQYTEPICMVLVDYEKSFDSGTTIVRKALTKQGRTGNVCEDTATHMYEQSTTNMIYIYILF